MTKTEERPILVSEKRRKANRLRMAAAGKKMLRKSSPGARILEWMPVTKSTIGTSRDAPSTVQMAATPSSAAVIEIIAPAGSDRQMFPPTLAVFQILKDASRAPQQSGINEAALHSDGARNASSSAILQVEAISSPPGSICNAGHDSVSRSTNARRDGCGSENSQVPPANQAKPSCHSGTASRLAGW